MSNGHCAVCGDVNYIASPNHDMFNTVPCRCRRLGLDPHQVAKAVRQYTDWRTDGDRNHPDRSAIEKLAAENILLKAELETLKKGETK